MKLLKCSVKNFGSYKELDFDYSETSLTLVYGSTGSGKSSLLDIAPWIMFGITAKDGNVDDVRSWSAQDEPTTGTLTIETPTGTIRITRIRGRSSQNDLYWDTPGHTELSRGKDIRDTQRLLNDRLGISPELFLAAAYASDFSPTASFFHASSKRQREVFDLVADLQLPTILAESTANARKEAKKELDKVQRSLSETTGRIEELLRSQDFAVKQAASWEKSQGRAIAELEARAENFETEKAQKLKWLRKEAADWEAAEEELLQKALQGVSEAETSVIVPCPTCGNPYEDHRKAHQHAIEKVRIIRDRVNPYKARIEDVEFNKPGFTYMIKSKKEEVNPHARTVKNYEELRTVMEETHGTLKAEVGQLTARVSSLTQLHDLSATLRGVLLSQTVAAIQAETNRILEAHYDGEFRIGFTLDDDSLSVSITKNGYSAVYSQLSKGQRQLLKLSFMISVMKAAANQAGMHFDNLFFDESLDGLDTELKMRSYDLFLDLSKSAKVIVVDHSSELKELFASRYHVTLNGDESEIQGE